MAKIGYINNFLNQEEINWFIWYWSQLPTRANNGQREYSLTHYDQKFFSRIRDLLSQKIKKHFSNEEITTVNLNWDYKPGGVHSDGYLTHDKHDKIAKTYLIPIVMDHENYHTLLFDKASKKAVTLNRELGLGNDGIVTYEQVDRNYFETLGDTPFNKEIYNQYLSHLDYHNLRGLSTVEIMTWNLGRAIYWPREQLHCSADFVHNSNRSSLLIVTRYVE